ncbi:hypothetical protein ACX6XY_08100 [Streptomyces sp. O3]
MSGRSSVGRAASDAPSTPVSPEAWGAHPDEPPREPVPPRTSRDAQRGTRQGTDRRTPQGIPREPLRASSRGVPQDTGRDASQAAPQETGRDPSPHDPGQGTARGDGRGVSQGVAREAGARGGNFRGRAGVDPVKVLMHRHRELCARAVDPLEIAAGLEAHGVTDRTAARFRHRDVFSLAEEMYARVPRDTPPLTDVPLTDARPAYGPRTAGTPRAPAAWAALALLPGAVCAAAVTLERLTSGHARVAVILVGALAVAGALRLVLRHGPLRARGRTLPATRWWVCWLLGYALLGDGLLRAALTGDLADPWPMRHTAVLGLALAVAPAAWCARLFGVRAERRLAVSRGLADFATAVRPVLIGVFLLFLAALATLLQLTGRLLGQGQGHGGVPLAALTLGALLLLARLLTAHGFPGAPAAALGGVCAAEALTLAAAAAGQLPALAFLATPVDTAVQTWGTGVVPATACGAAALALLVHAARTLTRASAHAHSGATS